MHQQRKTIARVGRGKRAVRATRTMCAEITVYDHLIFVNIRNVLVHRRHGVSSLPTYFRRSSSSNESRQRVFCPLSSLA